MTIVVCPVLGRVRVYHHPADRVLDSIRLLRRRSRSMARDAPLATAAARGLDRSLLVRREMIALPTPAATGRLGRGCRVIRLHLVMGMVCHGCFTAADCCLRLVLLLPTMVRSRPFLQEFGVNIGQASKTSGVSAKMIRYYEAIGLVPAADRRSSGYRDYGPADVHRLGFIRRARDLAFSMEEIRDLLRLWSDHDRTSREVKDIALRHIADLDQRARQLTEMADALRHLAVACEGNERPDCPIIKGLEGAPSSHPAHVQPPAQASRRRRAA